MNVGIRVIVQYWATSFSDRTTDLQTADTEDQKESFKKDPQALNKYCRDVEGELNKRFTLVSTCPCGRIT